MNPAALIVLALALTIVVAWIVMEVDARLDGPERREARRRNQAYPNRWWGPR